MHKLIAFSLLGICCVLYSDPANEIKPFKPLPLPVKPNLDTEPYCSLQQILPFDSHGWYFNSTQIENLFRSRSIKTVVEIGSWLGSSTRHIASLLPSEGKIYAIDHWKGSAEHQPGQSHWQKQVHYLYEQFLSNVILSNLTNVIIPLRMESVEAAKALAYLDVNLVYIDGSHDTTSVLSDLKAWYPYVQHRGVLCGSTWGYHEVQNAVKQFAREHLLSIHASGDFWQLKENFTPSFPIQFSISETKILNEIPQKTQDFAYCIPGQINTYIFNNEADYYADYQKSYFAITCKKAGWDCMRHYEILANGCIPYFLDLDACPAQDLSFFPKKLIKEAMNLEGVSLLHIDHQKFNKTRYFEILHQLLEYTRSHLSSRSMAKYLLESVHYNATGKILFLSGNTDPDYLRDSILIGLKENCPDLVIDIPYVYHIYKSCPTEKSRRYGKGFSYTQIINDSPIDRENIEQRIQAKEFELIIFGNVHRGLPFKDLVEQVYSPQQIVYLCGEDIHQCEYLGWNQLFLREFSGNLQQ